MKARPMLVLSSTDTHTVFQPGSEILPADWHTVRGGCLEYIERGRTAQVSVQGRRSAVQSRCKKKKNPSRKNIWKLLTSMLLSGRRANHKLPQKHFQNDSFFQSKVKQQLRQKCGLRGKNNNKQQNRASICITRPEIGATTRPWIITKSPRGDSVGNAAGTGGSRRQLGKGPWVGPGLVRGIIYPSWSSECSGGPPDGAGKHRWWERGRDHPAEPATTSAWLGSSGWMDGWMQ